MRGLKLAERYYNFYGREMIHNKFPDYEERIAVGLVGEGSDCFQFDDEISQDHDWGPAFCIWLNQFDYEQIGMLLQKEYENLPKDFAGIPPRKLSIQGIGRTGVHEINNFYKKFTGLDEPPSTWLEWLRIPEKNLAACTNGKVFKDEFGEFTFYREKLLEFYPEEVRLKKISIRCFVIGREGQYNIPRCIKRNSFVAAHYATSKFIEAAISLVYLLNYCYMPYYKWMHEGLINLPILGPKIYQLIQNLAVSNNFANTKNKLNDKLELVNIICGSIVEEFRKQQLSESKSNYLIDHSETIKSKIENEELRDF